MEVLGIVAYYYLIIGLLIGILFTIIILKLRNKIIDRKTTLSIFYLILVNLGFMLLWPFLIYMAIMIIISNDFRRNFIESFTKSTLEE